MERMGGVIFSLVSMAELRSCCVPAIDALNPAGNSPP